MKTKTLMPSKTKHGPTNFDADGPTVEVNVALAAASTSSSSLSVW
jgi:hypothetical protein